MMMKIMTTITDNDEKIRMAMMIFQSPGLREQGSSPEQMDSGFPNSRLMMMMIMMVMMMMMMMRMMVTIMMIFRLLLSKSIVILFGPYIC